MGFDLLMEIITFSKNKKNFTKLQQQKIFRYYRKKLKYRIGNKYLQNKSMKHYMNED